MSESNIIAISQDIDTNQPVNRHTKITLKLASEIVLDSVSAGRRTAL